MDNTQYHRYKQLKETEGTGTGLISLYIPAGKNIRTVRQRMLQEVDEAESIKSDSNKKNVKRALERVNQLLKQYQETPENGLALFVGSIDGDTVSYVFDDFEAPLNHSDYTCDSTFNIEPIEHLFTSGDEEIGLILIERGEAAIGELRNGAIKLHAETQSNIMSQHRAGGQSAQRFRRLIEEQKFNFFRQVADDAERIFLDEHNAPVIDALIIGGEKFAVGSFVDDHLPSSLKQIRHGQNFSVDYAGKQGLQQLVTRAEAVIAEIEEQPEREAMEKFYTALNSDNDTHATYGKDAIERALEFGAIDTLLLSLEVDPDVADSLSEACENKGGSVITISTSFEEGAQFEETFGGIGALLRYQID